MQISKLLTQNINLIYTEESMVRRHFIFFFPGQLASNGLNDHVTYYTSRTGSPLTLTRAISLIIRHVFLFFFVFLVPVYTLAMCATHSRDLLASVPSAKAIRYGRLSALGRTDIYRGVIAVHFVAY